MNDLKRNLLLIKGLLFQVNCFKCKKRLDRFSIKRILDNKFICNSCSEVFKAENKKIINELIEKYLSNKEVNFREGIKVIYNSISNIGLEPYFLDKARDLLRTNLSNLRIKKTAREMDEIIYHKSLYENSLIFLDELEKIQKLLKNKNIDVDYLTILAMFVEFMDIQYDKTIDSLAIEMYSTISESSFFKNISTENIIKWFIKAGWKFDSVAHFDILYKILDRFNLEYTKDEIVALIKGNKEKIEIEEFERSIGTRERIEIGDFKDLSGHGFEGYIQKIFELLGNTVVRTPLTGDQGADLIISKDNIKTAVQIKKYDGSISNKAIQEVVAARTYYKVDKAIVVTNSSFTTGAIDLALANNVELWDGQKLEKIIDDLKKRKEPTSESDFRKAIEVTPGILNSSEELEIYKTIMTNFLDPLLNLDTLIFPELSNDFVDRIDKLKISNEYSYVIDFAKKPMRNVSEYEENLSNLRLILSNKGFHFHTGEVSKILSLEQNKQNYTIFKKLMSSYPAYSLRDYLEHFVILYNENVSVLRDFRKAYEIILQIGFSKKETWLDKFKKEGIDIESLENVMNYDPDMKMSFESEENARRFMLGIAGGMSELITHLKKLLSENKVELGIEERAWLDNKELISSILSIRPTEIFDYDKKKKCICEFKISDTIFSLDLIYLNLKSKNKEDVLKEMVNLFTKSEKVKNGDKFYQNILDSERIMNTALGQNIAIPNASSDVIENMYVAIGISREGIDFDSLDGSLVKIIFMVAWNDEIFGNSPGPRIKLLAQISRFLKNKTLKESLFNAGSNREIFLILKENFNICSKVK